MTLHQIFLLIEFFQYIFCNYCWLVSIAILGPLLNIVKNVCNGAYEKVRTNVSLKLTDINSVFSSHFGQIFENYLRKGIT